MVGLASLGILIYIYKININDGKSVFYIKSVKEGSGSIIVSSQDAESQKLTIDFHQTESQRVSNRNKIFEWNRFVFSNDGCPALSKEYVLMIFIF